MTTSDNDKTPDPGTPQRQAEALEKLAADAAVIASRIRALLGELPRNLACWVQDCARRCDNVEDSLHRAAADLKRAT